MENKKIIKRLGRPPKQAVPGQRVSLGLRVQAKLKRALAATAKASGRSLSQEAELRLENSLKSDGDLMLVQGHKATPIVFYEEKVLIPVGYGAVALPISYEDREQLVDFFLEQWSLEKEKWVTPRETTEGVSLGLRVTPELKHALDRAASRSSTSQSQQVVWRLWNSINSDEHLLLVQGHEATPIFFERGKMWLPLTDVALGTTMSDGDRGEAVAVAISSDDQSRIMSYFNDQWPDPGREVQEAEKEEAADWWSEVQRGR